ncbi:MAG: PpiC-type peptidyl-prolyl cis-trans isomerase [candidate division TM6 bacterium GW2011_GWF2_28_16]|nr:MAG: PpiC-type peptidyl-prolyl cis-trans isomerase [candidate division TM6 bacterium GW2011_GWF2_28_16]
MNNSRILSKLSVAVLAVVFLSGCSSIKNLFQKKDVEKELAADIKVGAALLNIDGKIVVSEGDFDKYLTQMLQANPYFRGATAESLPKQLKRKFFDELIKQELIIAWANKNNVAAEEEFKKNYEELKKLVRRSLLVQSYEKKLFDEIAISDADVKDHFNKNKDKFVKEKGDVQVDGVEFADDIQASAFVTKVTGKEADFKKLAKETSEKTFKSFGRVDIKDYNSTLPKEIKDKLTTVAKFPSVVKVAIKNKVWVVCVSDKKDASYFSLDEVKDQLKEMLKINKFKEILNEKIDKLKNEFTLNINEDFFKDVVESAPAQAEPEIQETTPVKEDALATPKGAAAI